MSHSASTKKKQQSTSNQIEENDDDDEPLRVPLQLKLEFVNSVMFRQWPLAKKLCQFMLMYEPEHSQAKQYQPLIEFMLAKEQEGTSSSSSSDDDEDSSDDEDHSGSDSTSDTSSNEDEEKENASAAKPVNGSTRSHRCATDH